MESYAIVGFTVLGICLIVWLIIRATQGDAGFIIIQRLLQDNQQLTEENEELMSENEELQKQLSMSETIARGSTRALEVFNEEFNKALGAIQGAATGAPYETFDHPAMDAVEELRKKYTDLRRTGIDTPV